jgi:hypothetical protein
LLDAARTVNGVLSADTTKDFTVVQLLFVLVTVKL